ncbi:SDR family NAD(P)-dependent oxidoreductase [Streptomyces sp. NBC_00582]|uniref:SDR family NAD(P)-dependent oxidoreductase n=1 Tax=Streptomyces sp. NBC_00582 TaxID=2975783 RepID=UPI002E803737|nr:SDR family NAD(P)-dependent oxidoreductase [Streptomyces sp. NBC_00582]WUB66060.1 SDR family oxidoreductase [Streptomyces sp. NBC_00582]
MGELEGKRILVAGGAAGIGAATARRLGAEGAKVFLGDIDLVGAKTVAQEISEAGGTARAERFDLLDPSSIESLVADAVAAFGGLDGVANIAADTSIATMSNDRPLVDMDLANWERTLRANLTSYALINKHAIPHLIAAGGGSIVNMSSDAADAGEPQRPAYGASKAGINALTRHIAAVYGPHGVRANALSPGLVLSEQAEAFISDEIKAMTLAKSPIKRLGRPSDVAQLISFLLSDDADWVTGQVWHINGGLRFH